jgi:diphosphomevalonate decarboxylase
MNLNVFISKAAAPVNFITSWEAPSNIALIKYWGKEDIQIPKNPSLSFTLSSSVTKTSVNFKPSNSENFDFDFFFDGTLRPDFNPKLLTFFKNIEHYIPWINGYKLIIKSNNSFPHSSGIASSASAMAALSLCLMDLENYLFPKMSEAFFYQKASFLARLGSGSASRSIQGTSYHLGRK